MHVTRPHILPLFEICINPYFKAILLNYPLTLSVDAKNVCPLKEKILQSIENHPQLDTDNVIIIWISTVSCANKSSTAFNLFLFFLSFLALATEGVWPSGCSSLCYTVTNLRLQGVSHHDCIRQALRFKLRILRFKMSFSKQTPLENAGDWVS